MMVVDETIAAGQARFAAQYKAAADLVGVDGQVCPIEAGLFMHLADHECKHGRLPTDRSPACGCWPSETTTTPDLMTTLKTTKTKAKAIKPKPKPDTLTLVLSDFDREIERLTTARDELRKLAA